MNNHKIPDIMKVSKILTLLIALSAMIPDVLAQEVIETQGANVTIQIQNTSMANMRNAVEVLQMLPGVTVNNDNQIVVDGEQGTAVYIGTHKVADISELYGLMASKIESVKVINAPGAEYGKDVQSVIIFNLLKVADDGVSLSNDLILMLNNNVSFNDEFHLGYKHDKLNLGAYLSWAELRTQFHEREFVYQYQNAILNKATIHERDVDNRDRKIVAQANLGYDFTDNQHATLTYRLESTPYHKESPTGETQIYTGEGGKAVDFSKPSSVTRFSPRRTNPQSRHTVDAQYHGKWGAWKVDMGHKSMWYKNENQENPVPTSINEYNRKSYTMRNYLLTSVPLWAGSLNIGLEHNLQTMEVQQYPTDKQVEQVHTKNGINTLSDYISLSQKWGKFSATAGLRHEFNSLSYKPYDDDAMLIYIKELKSNPKLFEEMKKLYPDWESSKGGSLVKDGKIKTNRNHFYPNLTLSYDASEKSSLSLTFSRSYSIADLELSRIYANDGAAMSDKLLHTEHIYNTTLAWKYQWLALSASHNYYEDPLCVTSDSKNVFNGNNYHNMDLSITVTPKVGCWQPMLMLMLSKQWFDIELANGRTSMDRPRGTIHFNNTITLPNDWVIHANAEWYSKGDKRNVYFFRNDFMMNMSIQKEMLNKHLSIALKLENMLHSSWKDITTYNLLSSGVSNGVKSRKLTTISISAKYTL